MITKAPKLSIIMPVYNEKATLKRAILRLSELDINKEVIIFDDFSNDGSRELLLDLQKDNDFELILHEVNKGKGWGVINALKQVRGKYIIIEDSDLELSHLDIVKLLGHMESDKDVDIINGDRQLIKVKKANFISKFANVITSFMVFIFFGKWINDALSSYKLMETGKLKELNINSERFGFEIEVLLKSLKKGYKIKEEKIQYSPRTKKAGKKINWLDGFDIIWTIIKIRFSK